MLGLMPQVGISTGVNWARPVSDHGLNRGLVGWWLAGGLGFGSNKWIDISGNHNHGTLTNMDPATDWVGASHPGGFGSLDFDGSNDFVNVGSFFDPTNAFTLCCWFRTSSSSLQQFFGRDGGSSRCWQFRINAGNVNLIRFNSGHSVVANFSSTGTYDDGDWHHVLATFDTTNGSKIYVDGAEDGTDSNTTANDNGSGQEICFGRRRPDTLNEQFLGQMDDFRIFSRSVTVSEARQLHLDSLQGYPRTLNRIRVPVGFVAAGGGSSVSPLAFHHLRNLHSA